MAEDFIQAEYDITKKSKLRKFYELNKILIISFIIILIISFASFGLYLKIKEKNKILLSESYVKAKIYLENGKKNEAINILKEVIYANDSTYSTLCFFLILNQNLIHDQKELLVLFDHILEHNDFEKEIRNLLIYKKAVFSSNSTTESELLEGIKPLISTESLWKPHALLLLGDYFMNNNEHLKAKEFYKQVLSIKNLQKDMYEQTIFKLSLINNDQ